MGLQHMQIGEVASQTRLSSRTIRYYEEMGLVVPSVRSARGFRLYTDSDVARLQLVKRMTPLRFSLEEARELLEVRDQLGSPEFDDRRRGALVPRLEMFHDAAKARVDVAHSQLVIAEAFVLDLKSKLGRQRRASKSRN